MENQAPEKLLKMDKFQKSNLEKLKLSTEKMKQLTVENPNHFKTSRLGQSMTNYSNQLEREIQGKRRRNRTFKYGTVIYADFGINFGSEFSAPHYAITLEKNDSKNKNTITVIPLTSKAGRDNLQLEFNLAHGLGLLTHQLIQEAENTVKNGITSKYGDKELWEIFEELEELGKTDELERLNEVLVNLEDSIDQAMLRLKKYRSDLNKTTYVKLDAITTIDKVKIFKQTGPLDALGIAQLLEPQMKIISDEIKSRYLI
ncbi:type II toxin-antitoxin system PemK/MazF family toxin [Streptococcus sp. S784/96/1]|uniref:type II toxin-antitoxin system PemK/MazF family toxin n=1 Tax=Streptococcus sp. S784/96/1 TaxID=2653499 RepID=UPI001EE3FAB1|nr:type II toxin-antitoxin system PemK/MazF family toxin [Streptococcus sp. S784/96/1]